MKKILFLIFLLFFLFSCSKENNEQKHTDVSDITFSDENVTFIGFGASWCPHCNEEMPILDKFYKKNKDTVNMFVSVSDNKYFKGDYEIPQDISGKITYKGVTGEKCDLIPSFVIEDKNGNIIDKTCGSQLSYEDLEKKLLKVKDDEKQVDIHSGAIYKQIINETNSGAGDNENLKKSSKIKK